MQKWLKKEKLVFEKPETPPATTPAAEAAPVASEKKITALK